MEEASNNQTTEPTVAASESPVSEELPSKPFSEDTLYNLLVGELAVHDRNLATAAANYHHEAQLTRDIGVTARAAKLTRYLRDEQAAIEMGELWYELEPDSQSAADNLADLYAKTNRPLQALDVLEEQQRKGHKARFGLLRNSKFNTKSELEESITDSRSWPETKTTITSA